MMRGVQHDGSTTDVGSYLRGRGTRLRRHTQGRSPIITRSSIQFMFQGSVEVQEGGYEVETSDHGHQNKRDRSKGMCVRLSNEAKRAVQERAREEGRRRISDMMREMMARLRAMIREGAYNVEQMLWWADQAATSETQINYRIGRVITGEDVREMVDGVNRDLKRQHLTRQREDVRTVEGSDLQRAAVMMIVEGPAAFAQ